MKIQSAVLLVTGLIFAAGCSPHDDYPKTPSMSTATPTYRSVVMSTDLHVEPLYNQPGANPGKIVPLPVVPDSPSRWDANDAVAGRVYAALTTNNTVQPRALRVYGHRGIVWIQGEVSTSADRDKAIAVAKSVKTVKGIKDGLVVIGSS